MSERGRKGDSACLGENVGSGKEAGFSNFVSCRRECVRFLCFDFVTGGLNTVRFLESRIQTFAQK